MVHRETDAPDVLASPALRRERANYILIRGTGLILVVLALGHFALTHFITDVAETDATFIAERWGNIVWVVWDAVLLFAALAHAGVAIRSSVQDYSRSMSRPVYAAVIVVLILFGLLGVSTLILYQVFS